MLRRNWNAAASRKHGRQRRALQLNPRRRLTFARPAFLLCGERAKAGHVTCSRGGTIGAGEIGGKLGKNELERRVVPEGEGRNNTGERATAPTPRGKRKIGYLGSFRKPPHDTCNARSENVRVAREKQRGGGRGRHISVVICTPDCTAADTETSAPYQVREEKYFEALFHWLLVDLELCLLLVALARLKEWCFLEAPLFLRSTDPSLTCKRETQLGACNRRKFIRRAGWTV